MIPVETARKTVEPNIKPMVNVSHANDHAYRSGSSSDTPTQSGG
jgi:hypothetical protein